MLSVLWQSQGLWDAQPWSRAFQEGLSSLLLLTLGQFGGLDGVGTRLSPTWLLHPPFFLLLFQSSENSPLGNFLKGFIDVPSCHVGECPTLSPPWLWEPSGMVHTPCCSSSHASLV